MSLNPEKVKILVEDIDDARSGFSLLATLFTGLGVFREWAQENLTEILPLLNELTSALTQVSSLGRGIPGCHFDTAKSSKEDFALCVFGSENTVVRYATPKFCLAALGGFLCESQRTSDLFDEVESLLGIDLYQSGKVGQRQEGVGRHGIQKIVSRILSGQSSDEDRIDTTGIPDDQAKKIQFLQALKRWIKTRQQPKKINSNGEVESLPAPDEFIIETRDLGQLLKYDDAVIKDVVDAFLKAIVEADGSPHLTIDQLYQGPDFSSDTNRDPMMNKVRRRIIELSELEIYRIMQNNVLVQCLPLIKAQMDYAGKAASLLLEQNVNVSDVGIEYVDNLIKEALGDPPLNEEEQAMILELLEGKEEIMSKIRSAQVIS